MCPNGPWRMAARSLASSQAMGKGSCSTDQLWIHWVRNIVEIVVPIKSCCNFSLLGGIRHVTPFNSQHPSRGFVAPNVTLLAALDRASDCIEPHFRPLASNSEIRSAVFCFHFQSFRFANMDSNEACFTADSSCKVGVQAWEEELVLSRALFLIGLLIVPAAFGSDCSASQVFLISVNHGQFFLLFQNCPKAATIARDRSLWIGWDQWYCQDIQLEWRFLVPMIRGNDELWNNDMRSGRNVGSDTFLLPPFATGWIKQTDTNGAWKQINVAIILTGYSQRLLRCRSLETTLAETD